MSLKARLIAALCALVLIALAAVDTITYTSFRSYVVGQLDSQLYNAAPLVLDRLGGPGVFGGPPETNQFIQHGTMAAELNSKGQQVVTWQLWVESPTQSSFEPATNSFPILPASLASQAARSPGAPIYATVPGGGSVRSYRVFEGLLTNGNVLAEAVPLTGTNATVRHLLRLELLVSGAVLIALAAATLLVIRLSLRPLDDMAKTAGEIADGDLSRRVEDTDERTEVGRLGRALNVMLARIEAAFREREASEARLRRFVADASHELRTPLTSIRGYAELFRHGLADRPADLDTAMRRIESESTRMAGLVDDLLLLARLDQRRPLERETVDLATLAADAAQDARVIDPSRTVTCQTPAVCRIIGDESRLRQLLGNLVSNALAYTPSGSPFEIVLASQSPVGTAPTRVRIAVVDHGPGIPNEAVEHIFERFWRSDPGRVRDQGGAGLGLSIVLAIARAHGGEVSVAETPGGGATFIVELPTQPLVSSPWGEGSARDQEWNRNGAETPEPLRSPDHPTARPKDLSRAPESSS